MRAMEIGLAGVVAALIAAVPAEAYAQGRGNARGQDRGGDRVREQVIILDDDDDDDRRRVLRQGRRGDDGRRIVIRGARQDDRRVRRQNDRIILRDDRGRVIVIGPDRIDERFRARRGAGPPFCRSGEGHPVFGRRWCLERGFGLGRRGDVFFDDGRVIFWDDDSPVIVRDRRLRGDRRVRSERGFWEEALDRILRRGD